MFLTGLVLFLLGARGILWVLNTDIEANWFITKLVLSCVFYCGGMAAMVMSVLEFAVRRGVE